MVIIGAFSVFITIGFFVEGYIFFLHENKKYKDEKRKIPALGEKPFDSRKSELWE